MAPKKAKASEASTSRASQRKKRATSPSSPSNEHGFEFTNDDQRERYEAHLNRRIVPTRYVDLPTLKTLGIEDNVIQLFSNVGWGNFLDMRYQTYEKTTLEFLSTVEFVEDKINIDNPEHKLKFRLLNTDHEISLDTLCEIFGLANSGAYHILKRFTEPEPEIFYDRRFWEEISGAPYFNASQAKCSHIHNPVFRYIQRFMANVVFGRGDSAGVMRLSELFCLWHMVNNKPINTGYFIAHQLYKVGKATSGDIVMGGMITAIVSHLGYDGIFADLEPVEGSMQLDIEACIACRMIKPVARGYRLLINGQKSILLPDPVRTNINVKANWLYRGFLVDQEPEPAPEHEPNHEPAQEPQGVPESQQQPEAMVEDTPFPTAGVPSWMERFDRFEEEQRRQGQVLENLSQMMTALYTHFHPPPPPDQPM